MRFQISLIKFILKTAIKKMLCNFFTPQILIFYKSSLNQWQFKTLARFKFTVFKVVYKVIGLKYCKTIWELARAYIFYR